MDERLSIEDAIDAIPDDFDLNDTVAPEEDEADAVEVEEDEQEEIQDADPTADEEDEALDEVTESDEEEADEDDDAEDGPDEQVTVAVEIPKSWGDEEAKALWVRLPAEVQRQVATREEERDKATQRILSESGQERKKAVEATKALGSFAQRAEAALQAVEQAYSDAGYDQWTAQDWYNLSAQNPELYVQHKAYADQLSEQKKTAEQVRANARMAAQESFAEEQADLLRQHMPEVLEKHSEVVDYLGKTFGYTADQVRLASAADRVLAYKAMQFDRMNEQAKAKANSSKNQAKPAPKGLKSSAGQTSTSGQRKKANAAKAFKQKPSIENAINMLPDF